MTMMIYAHLELFTHLKSENLYYVFHLMKIGDCLLQTIQIEKNLSQVSSERVLKNFCGTLKNEEAYVGESVCAKNDRTL